MDKPWQVYLGTAMWGWTMEKSTCFALLDAYYQAGFRRVDTATNYPINGQAGDFRQAESWLAEWLVAHGIQDLEILVKVGSIDNLGGPDNRLEPSFLLMGLDYYRGLFQQNLSCFSLHWDNRSEAQEIQKTLDVLHKAQDQGLETGLSGIKHPEVYATLLPETGLNPWLQVKHHLFQSQLDYYQQLLPYTRPLAYGITAGGIKRNKQYQSQNSLQVRGGVNHDLARKQEALEDLFRQLAVEIPSVHHLGLLHAWHHPAIQGVLLGPSRIAHLESSLRFLEQLQSEKSWQETAEKIKAWQKSHPYFQAENS